ncbi:MAG: hypothetical protein AABX17_01965 [Nanoarchaeota archaeon]
MTVRDHLKQVGRRPSYSSMGESAECNTFYAGGIPRGRVSSFDRETPITEDSTRPTASTLVVYSIFDDCCDCSASRHPMLADSITIRRDFFSGQVDEITQRFREAKSRINRAHQVFLRAILDPHYTNPKQYASQSAR